MKKHLPILLLLLASFATHAQSDAYLRYAPNPNLNVAFVEGFRLDDSTTVDVTVITAKDSATLAWLCEEFNHTEVYNEAVSKQEHTNPRYVITWSVAKNDPTQHVYELIEGEYDFCTLSLYEKRVNIYHIINKQHLISIMGYHIRKISKKQQ